jgi:hypothetical protein
VRDSSKHFVSKARFRQRQDLTEIRFELAGIEQIGNPGQTFGCDGAAPPHKQGHQHRQTDGYAPLSSGVMGHLPVVQNLFPWFYRILFVS